MASSCGTPGAFGSSWVIVTMKGEGRAGCAARDGVAFDGPPVLRMKYEKAAFDEAASHAPATEGIHSRGGGAGDGNITLHPTH